MKQTFFILLSLISFNTWGNSNNNKQSTTADAIYAKTIIFQEFHDPGYLLSNEGIRYDFHYEGFTYENISTWEKGRKLTLSYSPNKDIILHDPKSGAYANVGSGIKDVIKLSANKCLNKATSTMGIAGCYEEEYKNWDTEMNRIYNKLQATYSSESFKVIQKMQRSWLKYRDNRYSAGRMVHADEMGTISIIESSSRVVWPVKEHTLFLQSLLKD